MTKKSATQHATDTLGRVGGSTELGLLRARNSKRIPQFLKLETPDIKFAIFPHEEIASLRTEFRNALDKISEELLALTIKALEIIDADLPKATKLMRM